MWHNYETHRKPEKRKVKLIHFVDKRKKFEYVSLEIIPYKIATRTSDHNVVCVS